jgi:hypothetical protein
MRIHSARRSTGKNLPCHFPVGGNPAPEFLDVGYLLFQRSPNIFSFTKEIES